MLASILNQPWYVYLFVVFVVIFVIGGARGQKQ